MDVGGLLATATQTGFRFGALLTALGLGFRHGIDWDHIAAITDITSSQDDRGRAILFGTLYALGHASVVFTLGILAIVAGEKLPAAVDTVMPRIVGATLLLLGIYVFGSLIRHGRDFRLRSRWMLVFAGVRRGYRWARRRIAAGHPGSREPAFVAVGPNGAVIVDAEAPSARHHGHHGLPGHHHHDRPEPDDAFMNYGRATSWFVGMIHGIGAETATQLLIFLTAAGVGGGAAGALVLGAFIVGLLASNTVITIGTAFGYMRASRNFALYASVAVITGLFSLVIGTIFLLGEEGHLLAPILGG